MQGGNLRTRAHTNTGKVRTGLPSVNRLGGVARAGCTRCIQQQPEITAMQDKDIQDNHED